jgi:DNA replication and repair protein RecF
MPASAGRNGLMAERAIRFETSNLVEGSARVRALTLHDFRSYAAAEIAFDGRPVALVGANGAGKTNLLEALSLLGTGRGLRGATLDDLPREGGTGGWAVSAELAAGDDAIRLGVGATAAAPNKRVVRIDGAPASGPSALTEHVRFVWLTPAQDRLFVDGAGERRRFLDRMACSRDAAHAEAHGAFEIAMRQRQKLLDDGSRDDAWLSALEWKMAEAGVVIAASRRETAGAIAAAEVAAEWGFPSADIALVGDLETELECEPAAAVEEAYAERLKCRRALDAAAGRALSGPHRSDLKVTHREKGRDARLCSTGEQKALLIGLVLANACALRLESAFRGGQTVPLVLLLDEIAAHLDDGRRAALFDILEALGFHAFMTGTDAGLFSAFGPRAQAFSVADGAFREFSLR